MALRDRILSAISKPAPAAPCASVEQMGQSRRPARILTPVTPAGLDVANIPAPSADRVAAALKRSAASAVEEVDDVGDDNRRFAKRKGRNSPGTILFPGISVPYNCLVRDTSSNGARLEMVADKFNQDAATDSVPNHFTLHLPLDRIQVECQSMWRRGSRIGVRFTSTVTVMPAPAPRPQIKGKK
jgi:hypothetical protein